MKYVDADELQRLLPMADAVDVIEAAFASPELPTVPQRAHIRAGSGDLLVMPAVGARFSGVKLVTVNPANPPRGLPLIHGAYVLLDGETLAPTVLIDGAALTARRTAAVSAVATRHLARDETRHLVLFGAGAQARSHLAAMCAVRAVERVTVVSRSAGPAQRLVEDAVGAGLQATVGTPAAVAEADLVCTCTTSPTPVFDGTRLAPGGHVNAVGAYTPDTRELDDATVASGRLVVEFRDAALAEAGDLIIPLQAGVIGEEAILAELTDVVAGVEVRRNEDDITVFKSVGHAMEDLAVAAEVAARLDP